MNGLADVSNASLAEAVVNELEAYAKVSQHWLQKAILRDLAGEMRRRWVEAGEKTLGAAE